MLLLSKIWPQAQNYTFDHFRTSSHSLVFQHFQNCFFSKLLFLKQIFKNCFFIITLKKLVLLQLYWHAPLVKMLHFNISCLIVHIVSPTFLKEQHFNVFLPSCLNRFSTNDKNFISPLLHTTAQNSNNSKICLHCRGKP